MRIAIAATGLSHVARGIEAWAHDLAYALRDRGVDTQLYKGSGEPESEIERIVPCVRRDSTLARTLSNRWASRALWRLGLGGPHAIEQTTFARRLLPMLREERVDLLHVQDPLLALAVQRAGARRKVATKVILGHGTEEPDTFLQQIEYLQHLAPWRLEDARTRGCYRPTWTAIPNFIDTDQFRRQGPNLREELGVPADATVVLSVAAIKRHHKRIDYLLTEFQQLLQLAANDNPYLLVAGGGTDDTEQLIQQGRQLLGDRVQFLVDFPRERMPDLYRTADLFAIASLNEMMPIALIEAAASGLPCVTNAHPVMQWMTGPGGVSGDLQVSGGLAALLEGWITDRAAREEAGRKAREHAVRLYSTDSVVQQLLQYYSEVLGQPMETGPASPATTPAAAPIE